MLARIMGGVGRSMMTAGTLILLFVAYQLWGTAIQEARSQNRLEDEFSAVIAEAADAPTTSTSTTAPATTTPATTTTPDGTAPVSVVPVGVAPKLPLPSYGDPVAKIELATIGVTRTVVEGVTVDQLSRGPGHYPESPLPGQAGNVAIAGHRTTYGQPFHNVDKLEPGDQIITTTVQGRFVYEVTGTKIVAPDEVSVLDDQGDNRLTLISCNPKYSLEQRIIVQAALKGAPAPEIAGQAEARASTTTTGDDDGLAEEASSIDVGLSGRPASNIPAIEWGLATAGIWLATWLVQTLIRRRTAAALSNHGKPSRQRRLLAWTPYSVGLPLFLVALYFFFENFARFLPGNY